MKKQYIIPASSMYEVQPVTQMLVESAQIPGGSTTSTFDVKEQSFMEDDTSDNYWNIDW